MAESPKEAARIGGIDIPYQQCDFFTGPTATKPFAVSYAKYEVLYSELAALRSRIEKLADEWGASARLDSLRYQADLLALLDPEGEKA